MRYDDGNQPVQLIPNSQGGDVMREDVREVLRVLVVILGIVVVCAILAGVITVALGADDPPASTDPSVEEAQWDVLEDANKEAGAGQDVPTPDELLAEEPWKDGCKGYCPSIVNGVTAGEKWCLSKKAKCNKSHTNRAYQLWLEFLAWIEESAGGKPGIFTAGTVRTESEGKVFGEIKGTTHECGLASMDLKHAEGLNINACDPRANLYAAGYYRNKRLIKLRDYYDGKIHGKEKKPRPDIRLAPLEDQWMLAGACGAIGSDKVIKLINLSGALDTKADGTLKWASPHKRVRKYLKWAHNRWAKATTMYAEDPWGLYQKPHLSKWLTLYTGDSPLAFMLPNPGKVSFRFSRGWAGLTLYEPMYPSGLPWGEPVLPERPDGLYPFPGTAQHCQCWRWPELEGIRPTPEENAQALAKLGDRAPIPPPTWTD